MPGGAAPAALTRATATAYLQPLREGGSLPAVLETDNGLYVAKFRGAGQGPRALIAELIVGLLARACGLPVPEIALVDVPDGLAADQRDPEIRELVDASIGLNVGLRYLDGAFNYDDAAAGHLVDPGVAAGTVWLDALVTNPDRTARNTNILVHERRPWLIDHGSALYAHHAWGAATPERTRTPFPLIRDHVLLSRAGAIEAADARLASAAGDALEGVLEAVPDALLEDPLARGPFASADEARARYLEYLRTRLAAPRPFVDEAIRARAEAPERPRRRLDVRR